MRFIKCHGSGNDFPLVDGRALSLSDTEWAQVARALADRAGPVGGDGLLVLTDGDAQAAFGMRMFNSDGSEAETCLNGLRCVARAGFEALGITRAVARLKTSHATVARAAPLGADVYTVEETAGPATLDIARWPLLLDGAGARLVDAPVAGLPTARRFTAVAMPNPHLVSFVEAVDDDELSRIGAVCEAAPPWLPHRANVSFVEVRGDDALFVRTFERGVGLTDSCGSAMAASTYAACLTGRIGYDREVTVFNRGGLVRARAAADAMVTLCGNATWEWEAEVTIDLPAARAGDLRVLRHMDAEIAAWARIADAGGAPA